MPKALPGSPHSAVIWGQSVQTHEYRGGGGGGLGGRFYSHVFKKWRKCRTRLSATPEAECVCHCRGVGLTLTWGKNQVGEGCAQEGPAQHPAESQWAEQVSTLPSL